MKNFDIWEYIRPNYKTRWLKLPYWSFKLLKRVKIDDSDFFVLVYLLSQVENIKKVYAPTEQGMEFCNINKHTYFRAIRKFKFMGLDKIGNGIYDMSNFIEFLKQQDININNVPLEDSEEENGEEND
jgi:hypothetical protein